MTHQYRSPHFPALVLGVKAFAKCTARVEPERHIWLSAMVSTEMRETPMQSSNPRHGFNQNWHGSGAIADVVASLSHYTQVIELGGLGMTREMCSCAAARQNLSRTRKGLHANIFTAGGIAITRSFTLARLEFFVQLYCDLTRFGA
eukprot:2252237-Rhodomonas_salina.2